MEIPVLQAELFEDGTLLVDGLVKLQAGVEEPRPNIPDRGKPVAVGLDLGALEKIVPVLKTSLLDQNHCPDLLAEAHLVELTRKLVPWCELRLGDVRLGALEG